MDVIQEQLRPQTIDEIKGLDHKPDGTHTAKELIVDSVMSDRAMCLLFVGPPGTGKTSMARVLAKKYLGEYYGSKYKSYNASTEIKVGKIRNEFIEFAGSEDESGKRNIIFLDEADGVGWQAQDALRAVIEEYSYSTIFILSANKKYRLNDALISRSTLFQFDPISTEEAIEWFKECCEICEIEIATNIPKKVLNYYKGDLRRVTTNFFTKFYGKKVYKWNPKKTYAQKIFNADDPIEKYKNMASKKYIEPVDLLHQIFELNGGRKYAKTFSTACDRIINGGDVLINVTMALQKL